jgi:alkylation response protein AidB-like acyl-CoA dehydrogenase
MAMPQADWRSAVPVETAAGTVPACELAAVDPAIAQVPQSHFLFVDVLAILGPAPVRQRLLAEVRAGARLANGMAERGGPHAQDLKTKLIRAGTGLRLSGRTYYCTAALTARWLGNYLLNDVLPPNYGQL